MGAGGVPGSLNGQYYPFSTYGRGAFVTPTALVVAQAPSALLGRWDIGAPTATTLSPPHTANAIAGGGGQWIALSEAPDGSRATLLVGTIPDLYGAGMGDVAFDGTIAFKSIYQSYDGVTIIPPGASRPAHVNWPSEIPSDWISIPDARNPYDLQALPGGKAVWRGGAFGRAPLRPFYADAMNMRIATTADGTAWLCYWTNARSGLILQPDGASEGYVLETRGVAYSHDLVAINNDLFVASSWTQGEGPGDIVKLRANRQSVTYLIDVDPQRVVPTWEPFEAPIVIPPITRPVWLGWFQFTNTPVPPTNCVLAVRRIDAASYPVIVTSETEGLPGPYVGYYVSGGAVEEVERQAQIVYQRGYVPYAYWDQRRWPRYPQLPPGSVLCQQAYCGAAETPVAFEADLRRLLSTLPPGPVALVAQQYTSNASLTTNLRALIPVFTRLVRDFPQIVALLPFSGYGRATGYGDHPEVHDDWLQLHAAMPGPPPLPPQPGDPPDPEPPDPEPPDGGDVDMTPQKIALRGPAGLFARIDPAELGQGMWRGYPIHFDRETVGEDETFELSKPDDRYQIAHPKTGVILGADATSNSADVCQQFYTSGGDVVGRGAYESWLVFRLRAGGTICALIEYDQDGVIYCSADLTVEEL